MKWVLFLQSALEGEKEIVKETTVWGLVVPILILGGVVLIIYLILWGIKLYSKTRELSSEWENLNRLLKEQELSIEEAGFMRINLKKLGYTNPTTVLKDVKEFEKFSKRMLPRPNHHTEFILAMVRKKVFDDSNGSRKPSETGKPTPSGDSGPVV